MDVFLLQELNRALYALRWIFAIAGINGSLVLDWFVSHRPILAKNGLGNCVTAVVQIVVVTQGRILSLLMSSLFCVPSSHSSCISGSSRTEF
jgi:hypothetical protein